MLDGEQTLKYFMYFIFFGLIASIFFITIKKEGEILQADKKTKILRSY